MLGKECREETKFLSVGDCHLNHPGENGWVPGAGVSKICLDEYRDGRQDRDCWCRY